MSPPKMPSVCLAWARKPSNAMELSIIIVSWNTRELLDACLASIYAHQDGLTLEVIVVDSASGDGTVEHVRQHFPQVRLLPQSSNVGFTRGNNLGLAIAEGRHLLLLNPDTVVQDGLLLGMVRFLDEHPEYGIVGPYTINTDGSTQSSRRHFPNRAIAILESTWLQPLAPPSLLAWYYITEPPDRATLDVDWVQGHALMARREVYEQIGGLDTQFVMYFEEVDWCKRAHLAGWKAKFLGDVTVLHHGGKSSDQVTQFKHIQYTRSKILYHRRYHGAWFGEVLRVILASLYAWQGLREASLATLGHKSAMRWERVRVYRAVLRFLMVGQA